MSTLLTLLLATATAGATTSTPRVHPVIAPCPLPVAAALPGDGPWPRPCPPPRICLPWRQDPDCPARTGFLDFDRASDARRPPLPAPPTRG